MSEIQILVLVLSFEGLLLVALGYAMPGMRTSKLVGIRIRPTLADERVWRDTHVHAGPRFRRVGWAIFIGGFVITAVPVPDWFALGGFSLISIGSFAWFIIDAYRYANARLAHYRAIDLAVHNG